MNNTHINEALLQLHQLLSTINQRWIVIGSASLMLSGYNIIPRDIDILANNETALIIHSLIKEYEVPVQLKDEGKFRSAFSRYIIGNISVELMGDLEVKTDTGWINIYNMVAKPIEVILDGKRFKVPGKEDQLLIYRLFNRLKDKAVIDLLTAVK